MTEIASHRGGAALWPENSEIAFRNTLNLDVEQIEFDVQLSADGVPVIFHDATLDRVTNGTGPVGAKTLDELKAVAIFNHGGQIMTLEEGLTILAPSDIIARCEIKPGVDMRPYPGLIDKTLDTFQRMGLIERTVITSFHLPTIADVAARDIALRDRIWLVSEQMIRLTSPQHVAMLARDAAITHIAPHHRTLRDGVLEALREEGLTVGAFAVLEDDAIQWALDNGLSVFTTDRPDAAVRLRAA
ncbi:MAG: glycerophosphodiester phosphodiesterase family protein [Pseudomonadota bacterium]